MTQEQCSCNYRYNSFFISPFLFYCLLLNHSFPTNPNKITNCFKTFLSITTYNYIAPASLFWFLNRCRLSSNKSKRYYFKRKVWCDCISSVGNGHHHVLPCHIKTCTRASCLVGTSRNIGTNQHHWLVYYLRRCVETCLVEISVFWSTFTILVVIIVRILFHSSFLF